ncbi:2,5-diamino-6-ribosylamino-4(3H)-pyrimidinone 5'-phosphate reductase [Candidatus Gugararchaeum adminiculabundum]|nr:2,5-diamino-6-ribosylamino-4(3H)-pyrimidinone 5'-phosphate reductase [Candidatus Gugararchaeum adminiculabundum]
MGENESADEKFMKEAIALAASANPFPNPRVGAVIVKNGKIIGRGFHRRAGEAHAEVEAINSLGDKFFAKGATIYVTLEPCSHYGKTPPCTKAIIETGIKRVVFGARDPTEKVCGEEELREAGIEVEGGIMEKEAEKLNPEFHGIGKDADAGLPAVSLKTAVSLDGKIACNMGESRWISSEESRKRGHELRAKHDAVIVGIETVLRDNPRLTTRLASGKNPLRVVLDSKLRVPLDARIFSDAHVVIATSAESDRKKKKKIEETGAKVLEFPGGRIPPGELLAKLAGIGVSSALVEGGGEVNASFVASGLVQRYYIFVCPKIIGGRNAKTAVEGDGIFSMNEAKLLVFEEVERVGDDILIVAKPKKTDGK